MAARRRAGASWPGRPVQRDGRRAVRGRDDVTLHERATLDSRQALDGEVTLYNQDSGPNSVLDDRSGRLFMPRTTSRVQDFWDLGGGLRTVGVRALTFGQFLSCAPPMTSSAWAGSEASTNVASECTEDRYTLQSVGRGGQPPYLLGHARHAAVRA
ncbi:hypothetical protein T492DRAFT_835984 [Pavlovales sp. CCMP2436]|nr:hypothetical protein T492DRAFT_835984 [Pavlovales sp. CCMP2436]